MIYLSCQPAISRYSWEVEVYLTNFAAMGVPLQNCHVVCGYSEDAVEMPEQWQKLQAKFQNVKFFFYADTRDTIGRQYQPSLQAHLLEKHWLNCKWLEREAVFFHDADFIFTKPFDFTPYLTDQYWYFSDTVSYIGANYIRSKGELILDAMCTTAGIDKQIVIDRQQYSGGAQKLIKQVTSQYWQAVYNTSLALWQTIPPLSEAIRKERAEAGETYHVLQHWTMSMWAELWEGWKAGFQTRVPQAFDFMFATNPIADWDRMAFFHNAGVLQSQSKEMFFKGNFANKTPYEHAMPELNPKLASSKYFEWIKRTGQQTCL